MAGLRRQLARDRLGHPSHLGEVDAVDSPIGRLPRIEDLNLDGLEIPQADLDELFSIDTAAWSAEADSTEEFFSIFGDHLLAALRSELEALRLARRRALIQDPRRRDVGTTHG